MGAGIATIACAGGVGLVTVFFLWHRIPAPAAYGIVAACGVGLAAGGLLVQDEAGAASWLLALAALGVLAPVHTRLVFGPPGPASVVAAGPAAA